LKKSSRKTVNAGRRQRRKKPTTRHAGPPGNSVFLVGFMGAGKSSVGRSLGQRLNWIFEDLDDRIAAREGRTVAEIFRDSGESEFRRAERAVLEQVLGELHGGVARIVALGGGTFAQGQNHKKIQASGVPTVFLDAPVEELWQRCAQQPNFDAGRPLQTSASKFRELHKARLPYYRTASLRIDTAGKQVDAIAAEIAQALRLKIIATPIEEGDVE
jgi:shikimate kinase